MWRIAEQTKKLFFRSDTKLIRTIPFLSLYDLKIKHQALRSTLCRKLEQTTTYFEV